ncbi:MAG TPA: hypothetical protein PLH43_12825 [Acetivibrio sp.]|uniref:hypothetical protein n=1 Tax=Acetivibrio sp. TaxID=1872092 RepID=UPI002D03380D|nr:hypothetical protein [Acetivibrio sp.]HOM03688.1 hypothetical protein [Acetivibrio sp.]
MSKNKNKQKKANEKNIKDASGKYEFANDQLGENIAPKYEELKQDKKTGKKSGKK